MREAVVIFGATGFVGRNLVAWLSGKVARIVAVSRSGARVGGASECVPINQLDDIRPLPADAVVINLAAQRYDASRFDMAQSDILATNVEIADAIYRFCISRGLREVRAASSVAVYEAGLALLDDRRPIDLNTTPNPNEAFYAWSKRWGEIVAKLYQDRFGVSTISFRLSNPYGPHDSVDPGHAHVLPAFVMRALAPADSFVIKGSPRVERDFVYIDDVCETFEASLGWVGKTAALNLCAGRTTTLYELAETILAILGDQRPIVANDESLQGVAARRSTNAMVIEATGKSTFATLREGLIPTLAWYRDALATSRS
jgi:UDP-glucose 4-epimerase